MLNKYKILAHWYYYDNFGDLLTPYIIERLSGCKVLYRWAYNDDFSYWGEIKELLTCIRMHRKYDVSRLRGKELKKDVILGIGSIIDCSYHNSIVWGAGFMNESESFVGGKIVAVRGKYTAEKLSRNGVPVPSIVGDPALLLPLVYNRKDNTTTSNKIGIIPHLKDESFFRCHYPDSYIISLKCNYQVESVIDRILECGFVISTSLHGLIVAHAYGIPAIWVQVGDIDSDGFKFKDYFSSVGISEYLGTHVIISDVINSSIDDLKNRFASIMLPVFELKTIQKELLLHAPFSVLPEIVDIFRAND